MTSDLDTQIRSGLERLAGDAAPTGVAFDDVLGLIAERRAARRRMRRVGATLCLVAVLGGAALAAIAELGADESQISTESDVVTDTSLSPEPEPGPAPEAGEPEPDPGDQPVETGDPGQEVPLSPRGWIATAWTGSELVVWGGAADNAYWDQSRFLTDGAAYNPATDEWRAMSPAPIDALGRGPLAIATGDEVIVISNTEVAAWDPMSDTWRELDPAPGEVVDAVWTGTELVASGTWAALDPSTGRWRSIEPPRQLDELDVTWTGDRLLVFGREPGNSLGSIEGQSYDPATDAWRDVAVGPLRARGFASARTGEQVVVVNYLSEAAMYDPAVDRWTSLPPIPTNFGEDSPRPFVAGDHIVVNTGGAVSFVGDRSGRWVPTEGVAGQAVHAGSDGTLLVLDERRPVDADDELVSPVLRRVRLDQLLNPPTIWLGGGFLTLTDTIVLDRIDLNGSQPGWSGRTVHVLVDAEACAIDTRFGESIVGTPTGDPVEIVPDHGGEAWTAYLRDSGRSIRMPTGSTTVTCDEASTTLALGHSITWANDNRDIEQMHLQQLARQAEALRYRLEE